MSTLFIRAKSGVDGRVLPVSQFRLQAVSEAPSPSGDRVARIASRPGSASVYALSRGWAPSSKTMTHSEMSARISVDPGVCFGKPCIKGTRIWVSLILDNLAEGVSEAELLKEYPQLRGEDIRAVLAFAAEATRERVVDLAPVTP